MKRSKFEKDFRRQSLPQVATVRQAASLKEPVKGLDPRRLGPIGERLEGRLRGCTFAVTAIEADLLSHRAPPSPQLARC